MHPSLTLYRWLAQRRWLKHYLGKFQIISFFGIHIPLLSIILYLIFANSNQMLALPLLLIAILATLGGSVLTLYIQRQILAPVLQASEALNRYLECGVLPDLPMHFADEAGTLMANTQLCICHLDRLLKFKHDMLAVVTHDIRSPIMSTMLMADLITKEIKQEYIDMERLHKYTNMLKRTSQDQLELINDTLTLMQSETDNLTIQVNQIQVAELLNLVYETTKLQAMQKGLAYTLTHPHVSHCVQIDVAKTRQVLINLVNNAIKFTLTGGSIELGAAHHEQTVEFWVKDTGIGIDAARFTELFKPFSTSHRLGTAQESGNGLGLWICKTFVEAQGGWIMAESNLEKGSCFRVCLPQRQLTMVKR